MSPLFPLQAPNWFVPRSGIDYGRYGQDLRERVASVADRQWLEDITFLIMAAALDCGATDRPAAAEATFNDLLDLLLATFDRLQPERSPAATTFMHARCLFAVLTAASQTGSDRLETRRTDIAALVAPLFPKPLSAKVDPLRLSDRNNHSLMAALVALSWGRLTDDAAAIATAIEACNRYAEGVDEYGNPVHEAVRGASAAWYVNLAVMLMTTFCWLAHAGGHLPICGSAVGLALQRAVPFLDRAVQNPVLLHGYARQNLYPNALHGTNPLRTDLGFLHGYHSSRYYMGWLPLYLDLSGDRQGPAFLLTQFVASRDYFPRGSEFTAGFPIRYLDVDRVIAT